MKKIIIVVILIFIVVASLWKGYYFFYKQIRWYDFDIISISEKISFPIKSARNAATYAKQSDKYSFDVANQQLNDQGISADWKIRTELYTSGKGKAGDWSVLITSKGVLPSYSCKLGFQSDGTWTLWNKCAWNK